MKNVAAYIRVSTEGQCGEDKFGLEAQKEQIEEYCKKNDMKIVKWYTDEGESGAKRRPGFDSILYGKDDVEYEAVVAAKSDRIARDINVYFWYRMELLTKKNVSLISVAEDFGKFGVFSDMLRTFTICCAQMERDNITKRTSSGRSIKASNGGYSGGKAPMGYKVKDGALVINEEEAKTVKRAFELRDSGETIRSVVSKLNEEGYRGRKGNPFTISTIQSILGNRKTYEGYYRYGKDGEWVKGKQEPILEEKKEG